MSKFLIVLLAIVTVLGINPNALLAQDVNSQTLKNAQASFATDRARQSKTPPKPLTIGDAAPPLDIEHWIHDGDGAFNKVTEFQSGKIYVIGFWETTCAPCLHAMPHIAALQKLHAKDGVQFISVTDENLKFVQRFLEREIPNAQSDDPRTYRQQTRSHCLTADPDGSVNRDYMQAANQSAIPITFLVGKKGRLEWIGHPMSVDEPLKNVIADQWDRDAFEADFKQQQQANEALTNAGRKMMSNDIDGAVKVLDEYLANGKLETEKVQFRSHKLHLLAHSSDHRDATAAYALELIASDTHDASTANDLAWSLYLLADAGEFEDQEVLQAALKLALEKSVDAGKLKPYILDTVAHLQHFCGNHKEALETQKQVLSLAEENEQAEFKEFLEELEAFHQKYGAVNKAAVQSK